LFFVFFFWDYSIDDAFITFRYAEHFADGHGLVFNIDDQPVEGYSNLLWLLILALIYKIGLPTYFMAKLLGILSFLLSGLLLYRYFKEKSNNLLWITGPLFLAFPITAFWGISGLELGLHTLLLTFLLISLFKRSRYAFVWLPFLVISRPEGPIIALVLLIMAAVVDLINREMGIKYYIIGLGIIVLTVIGLVLFRMEIFGYPLPNTYYAKSHHLPKLGYIITGRMILKILPYMICLIIGIGLLVHRRLTDKKLALMVALFVAQALISASVDPVMNIHYRYLIPVISSLIAVSVIVICLLRSSRIRQAALVVLLAGLYVPLPAAVDSLKLERKIWAAQEDFVNWAKPFPDSTTISMTDMGRIPYYADKTYFDIWGLLNKDIGQAGFNPIREFERLPEYFALVGYIESRTPKLRFWREQRIAYNKVFHDAYGLETICMSPGVDPTVPGYYYLVFKRKPEAFEILSRIKRP
jgi:hypothetical protein